MAAASAASSSPAAMRTEAVSVATFTFENRIPGTLPSARCTRPAQAAQVMPAIGREIVGRGARGASGMVPGHVGSPIMGGSRPCRLVPDHPHLPPMPDLAAALRALAARLPLAEPPAAALAAEAWRQAFRPP